MANKSIPINTYLAAATCLDRAKVGVLDAMSTAISLHGECTTDPVRGALNLTEEVGEVAQEALDATRETLMNTPDAKIRCLCRMVRELDQVAGYAILLRCSMEGEIERLHKEKS